MKKLMVMVLFLIAVQMAFAIEPEVVWKTSLATDNGDQANSVINVSGGYVVAGFGDQTDYYNGAKVWLAKFDNDGNLLWNQSYRDSGNNIGSSVIQTSDGGFLIAGLTDSSGMGMSDALLIKTDSNGNMQWNKTYGGEYADRFYDVKKTSDGGCILFGVYGVDDYSTSAWMLKLDNNYDQEWSKTYEGIGNQGMHYDGFVGGIVDGTNYVANGYAQGETGVDLVFSDFVVKTDSSGNEIWNFSTSGPNNGWGTNVITKSDDGGYVVGGLSYTPDVSVGNVSVIKLTNGGSLVWEKSYGSVYSYPLSMANNLIKIGDGNYVLSGVWATGPNDGDTSLFIMKVSDSTGNMIWNNVANITSGLVSGSSVVQAADNGYVVAGYGGSAPYDFIVAKLMPVQQQQNEGIPETSRIVTWVGLIAVIIVVGVMLFRKK